MKVKVLIKGETIVRNHNQDAHPSERYTTIENEPDASFEYITGMGAPRVGDHLFNDDSLYVLTSVVQNIKKRKDIVGNPLMVDSFSAIAKVVK